MFTANFQRPVGQKKIRFQSITYCIETKPNVNPQKVRARLEKPNRAAEKMPLPVPPLRSNNPRTRGRMAASSKNILPPPPSLAKSIKNPYHYTCSNEWYSNYESCTNIRIRTRFVIRISAKQWKRTPTQPITRNLKYDARAGKHFLLDPHRKKSRWRSVPTAILFTPVNKL